MYAKPIWTFPGKQKISPMETLDCMVWPPIPLQFLNLVELSQITYISLNQIYMKSDFLQCIQVMM